VTEPTSSHFDPEELESPLRDRLPEYLIVFGVGLVGAAAVGALIGAVFDPAVINSIGYTIMFLGVVLILAGGATGGGYTNLGIGAIGAMFGTRRADEEEQEWETRRTGGKGTSSSDRLAKGLRPERNPRAFWQVIGGLAYMTIGFVIVLIGG
jgi:hypothetical protein